MERDALKSGRYIRMFLGNLLPPLSGIPNYTKITTLHSRRPKYAYEL